MSKVLIKKSEGGGPQVATQPAGGIGLVMPAPSWNKFDSQKYEDAGYSPKAVAAARRWHTIGNIGRGAATGLGALNAVYNQTASGEPGVLNAAVSGGYQGLAGSQGLADLAGEWGARRGQRRDMLEEEKAKKERDSMADPNYPSPYTAPPTQNNTAGPTQNQTSIYDYIDQQYGGNKTPNDTIYDFINARYQS